MIIANSEWRKLSSIQKAERLFRAYEMNKLRRSQLARR